MSHVSKIPLDKENFFIINKQLYKLTNILVRSGQTKVILNELLTKTERVMVAKRLAIIVMLCEGESTYAISHILKVSFSTVGRMSKLYERGKYNNLIKEIKLQKNFWTQIRKIIPPRTGRDRFKDFLQF